MKKEIFYAEISKRLFSDDNLYIRDCFYNYVTSQVSNNIGKMLDFGCGFGLTAVKFQQVTKELTLVDIDELAMDYCRHQFSHVSNIKIVHADELSSKNQYNNIYCFLSLHHIHNYQDIILKLKKMLIDTGKIWICEMEPVEGCLYHQHELSAYDGLLQGDLERDVHTMGLNVVDAREMGYLNFKSGNKDCKTRVYALEVE